MLKYLINTGEEVDVKDGLEGGSNKREHESIYEKDVNSIVGLRENACGEDKGFIMGSNQKRIHREWIEGGDTLT